MLFSIFEPLFQLRMKSIKIENLEQLESAAQKFLLEVKDYSVIAFYGAMGAGKTTFIKALCSCLGVLDNVNSPTFNIINEYATDQGDSVFHFDFYRIEKPAEALDIGFEEYAYSGNLCLIEWPQKIEQILPNHTLKVHISVQDNYSRILSW